MLTLEEYLTDYLSNPSKKLPTIVARGYNNPELTGNRVAMKSNGIEISWARENEMISVGYCYPTTIKDSPSYGIHVVKFYLINDFDTNPVGFWNNLVLDPEDEFKSELDERIQENEKILRDEGKVFRGTWSNG